MLWRSKTFHWAALVLALAVGTGVPFVALLLPASAANQITLSGTVAHSCTIAVSPDPAALALNLTNGDQRVQVGTILQDCNKKAGYTIVVTSANCSASPTGAKLAGASSTEYLKFSVEAQNPTTGGSTPTVTNLLKTTCTNQNVRAVSNSKISSETSTIFASYSGNASLSADTYTDTLTFTINVN